MAAIATATAETIADKPPRRKRWIPLSVRMFAAMLLIVFVGGAVWMGVRFYRQQQVIREIRQANGTVEFESAAPDWLHERLNDDWLAAFGRISEVTLPFSDSLDADTTHLLAIRPLPALYIEGGPPVHDLIRTGRLDEIRSALAKHRILLYSFDPDQVNTLLHIAVSEGEFDIQQRADLVKFLLEQGLDVDAPDALGFTPLNSAAHPAIVKLLLDHGANLAADGPNDRILDEIAYRFAEGDEEHRDRWLEIAHMLIAAGAKYDHLVPACRLNDLDRVHKLLERAEYAQIQVAFLVAADLGRAEIVKVLLEHGADPYEIRKGRPIVYDAIRHHEVLQVLFDRGLSLDAAHNWPGNAAWTLLHEAAVKGAVESAQLLISHGIPVDAHAHNGMTPLHAAAESGQVAVVKLLLDHHADINKTDENGRVPLHRAAVCEFKPQLVRLLLEAGAKPDVKDRNGQTPLDLARIPLHGRPLTEAEEQDRAETIRLLSEP